VTIKRIAASAIAAILPLALALVLSAAASAFPTSYAREHPAACAEAWAKQDGNRYACGSRDFCAAHKNDDRIGRMICDAYVSRADPKLDSITLSGALLDTARNLREEDTRSECQGVASRESRSCEMVTWMRRTAGGGSGNGLLPGGMKTAKLALRADIQVYTFPVTVVRLGIGPGRVGVMEVTWSRNGHGPRETHRARLTQGEIDRLLAAVNRSDFWRLPHQASHLGSTGGEAATVDLSVAGWKEHVNDIIGDAEAADLSILVNELIPMIKSRWKDALA